MPLAYVIIATNAQHYFPRYRTHPLTFHELFAESDERYLSAAGHDTPIFGALRSVQESHGSDLNRDDGVTTSGRWDIIYFIATLTAKSIRNDQSRRDS